MLKQADFISHSSEVRNSEISILAWSGSGEVPLPGLQRVAFLLCYHMVERDENNLSGVSLDKDTNPNSLGPLSLV